MSNEPGSDNLFLTVKEVAVALRVTTRTVRNWIKSGRLRVVRAGRRVLVPQEELQRFLRLNPS